MNTEYLLQSHTIPQFTKYELILFWFFTAAHQKASKNTTFVVNQFAFIWQKKAKYLELLLVLERSYPTFWGVTFDSVELQKWSCNLKKRQNICQKLLMYLYGTRTAHCNVRDYFLKSGQANFCQIRYSSCEDSSLINTIFTNFSWL